MLDSLAGEPAILLSRRRAARRRPRPAPSQRGRETLPDWVWGAVLGVVVLIAVGGYFLATGAFSSGGGPCDKALVPLGSSDTSQQGFQAEDAGLGKVLSLLNSGDSSGAESAFFGPVHNFTHNADPPVRKVNEKLARDLCQAVITLEDAFAFRSPTATIAADTQEVRNLLRDSAQALGYARPG